MATPTQSPDNAIAELRVQNDTDADAQIRDGYSVRVAAHLQEVFGSREKAAWWMKEPNAALDGRTPINVALTAPGAVVVEELLAGIEHGFPL